MMYLRLRGNVYQFERSAPTDIRSTLGFVSWRETLDTDGKTEAEARCRKRTVETDDIIKSARDGSLRLMSDEETDWLAIQWSRYFQSTNRENIPRDMFPDVFQDEPDIRESV